MVETLISNTRYQCKLSDDDFQLLITGLNELINTAEDDDQIGEYMKLHKKLGKIVGCDF